MTQRNTDRIAGSDVKASDRAWPTKGVHVNVRHPLATANLPLIPTTTVGSMSPPGWLVAATQAVARDEFGSADIEELLTDAVEIAVLDQQRAGVDVLVDG